MSQLGDYDMRGGHVVCLTKLQWAEKKYSWALPADESCNGGAKVAIFHEIISNIFST